MLISKIKICDSIPGSGKTEAAIRYINSHPEKRFLFVTPFLDETERIVKSCPKAKFATPVSDQNSRYSKANSLQYLLQSGRNIAMTHALLNVCASDISGVIEEYDYVLILDEAFNMFEKMAVDPEDIDILQDSGRIAISNDHLIWIGDPEYSGQRYKDVFSKARTKTLFRHNGSYMYWLFSGDVFTVFNEVYILTYLFDGQPQRCYFDANDIRYEYIGVIKTDDGFEFSEEPTISAYGKDLIDKIHILYDDRANSVGIQRCDLSSSWYKKRRRGDAMDTREAVRRALYNVFRNKFKASPKEFMWTCFADDFDKIKDKHYTRSFVSCNARATNQYRHKKYLGYCVNVFLDPNVKNYFVSKGVRVNDDMYALSELVQWIFRSAIRDGEDIYIYIPSIRMRTLLENWLNELAGKGGESIC